MAPRRAVNKGKQSGAGTSTTALIHRGQPACGARHTLILSKVKQLEAVNQTIIRPGTCGPCIAGWNITTMQGWRKACCPGPCC